MGFLTSPIGIGIIKNIVEMRKQSVYVIGYFRFERIQLILRFFPRSSSSTLPIMFAMKRTK